MEAVQELGAHSTQPCTTEEFNKLHKGLARAL